MRIAITAALALGIAGTAHADPRGIWLVESGKSHVKIEPCGEKLCGKIVWLREPLDENGKPILDEDNDDESLRDRPIMGLPLIGGFRDAGNGEWTDGFIYNPEDGDTYRSTLTVLDPDTLKVRGCVFIFCKSQRWTRVK